MGDEFGSAGVDPLEHRPDAEGKPHLPQAFLVRLPESGDEPVGEAVLLGIPQDFDQFRQPFFENVTRRLELVFHLNNVPHVVQEPGVYAGDCVEFIHLHADTERVAQIPEALPVGGAELLLQQCLFFLRQGPPGFLSDVEQS